MGELSFFPVFHSLFLIFFLKQCFCCAPPTYTKFTCGELQNAHQPMFGHIQAPVQTDVYFGLIIQSTLLTKIHWCRSGYGLCTRKVAAHCSSEEDVGEMQRTNFTVHCHVYVASNVSSVSCYKALSCSCQVGHETNNVIVFYPDIYLISCSWSLLQLL